MREAPEEFGASFLWWSVPANPYFPAEHHGKKCVIPLVVYVGDLARGQQLIQPLLSLGTPLVDLSGPIPWTVLQGMFDPFVPRRNLQYYWKSIYLNGLGDEAVDFLVERAAAIPSTYTYWVILPFGGAMSRVGAEDTALHGDHLQRGRVVSWIGRARAVGQQEALVPPVVRVPHRRVHADVGGDPGQDDVRNAADPEQQVQVGGVEGALARLVDDRLAVERGDLRDDLPARLAPDQDPPARAFVADARADRA